MHLEKLSKFTSSYLILNVVTLQKHHLLWYDLHRQYFISIFLCSTQKILPPKEQWDHLYHCLLVFCVQKCTLHGFYFSFFSPSQLFYLYVGSKCYLFSGSLNINLKFTQFVCGETATASGDIKKQVLEMKKRFIPIHSYNIRSLKTVLVYAQNQHLHQLLSDW